MPLRRCGDRGWLGRPDRSLRARVDVEVDAGRGAAPVCAPRRLSSPPLLGIAYWDVRSAARGPFCAAKHALSVVARARGAASRLQRRRPRDPLVDLDPATTAGERYAGFVELR